MSASRRRGLLALAVGLLLPAARARADQAIAGNLSVQPGGVHETWGGAVAVLSGGNPRLVLGNLSVGPAELPGYAAYHATSEATTGVVTSGSYQTTRDDDGVGEVLAEKKAATYRS